jgi:23S rRNA U2552 (ribose-2'-O)-methylase RlmE/FtsJ
MTSHTNWLREYFDAHRTGKGIYKWLHYFDVYEHHFARFRGTDVKVLEIGVASGGSLEMWKEYFGEGARIYGVDIREACREREGPGIEIHIGDQADPEFWNSFKKDVPPLDVIIDDGGHEPQQQRVTFEELYSHLLPGGVYVCEDVHGSQNDFANYMQTWASGLNFTSQERTGKRTETNEIQRTVKSVSFYPFIVVVEKHWEPVDELVARKRGDEWLRRKRPSV